MSPRARVLIACTAALFLSSPGLANAGPKAAKAKKTKKAPAAKKDKRIHAGMRSGSDIARGRRVSVAGPSGKIERTRKAEANVNSAEASAPASAKAAATTPFEISLQTVRDEVTKIAPSGSGKISVSYAVGPRGRLRNIMVIGFDSKLDVHLEGVLAKQVFPRRYAGQRFNTTLVVRASAKARSPKSPRSPRSAARPRRPRSVRPQTGRRSSKPLLAWSPSNCAHGRRWY